MVFPVVMCGCESLTIKKAESWRINAFELWCWRRLLTVSWNARRSNQLILKEISPEYSLEGLMLKLKLKLKLQYFDHLMWRADSLEKTLMLGKIEGRREEGNRGWNDWTTSPNQWTWVWANSGSKWRTWKSGLLQSVMSQRVGHDLVTEQQHLIYLWIIFIPPAGSKGIKGYKVVWLKDLLVGFYGLHTLKFQIVRGRYLGRQCIHTSRETAVAALTRRSCQQRLLLWPALTRRLWAEASSLKPPMGLLTVTVGCFYDVTKQAPLCGNSLG